MGMSDRLHLIHCEEFLKRIEKYAGGGRAGFMGTPMQQDAVLWCLQMICLYAKRVSAQVRIMHPEVDWDRLCGLCAGLLDGDLRPNLERAWEVVQNDVPALRHSLRLMLTAKV